MHFVCRWRDTTPLSKRVVRVPDATVLEWFRRGWERDDAGDWVCDELGGDVYGLESIFDKARELGLPRPETLDELRALLHEHLYVEGDEDYVRLGERALRVRTDDDEVDLSYYFIHEDAAAEAPERVAYLLYDSWPLPTGVAAPGAVFDHRVPVQTLRPASPSPDCVFSVRIGWQHPGTGTNLDLEGALAFPGLTLPELAPHLRGVDPAVARWWPADVRMLRALIAPGEDDIGPAMHRYARCDGYDPAPDGLDEVAEHAAAHGRALRHLPAQPPAGSRVHLEPHVAQVARHIDDFFGYDQWFLFDNRWAAANRDLARSLLRYAAQWDPFAPNGGGPR
ncbi:hypothetical protein [Dactylosporangium sp. CA-233914]|uniref:hypothetical protein n=1 Tax=Dactylosporangium sp. CA-233914 TaxID=3239934 RepID=UPI003D8D8BF6